MNKNRNIKLLDEFARFCYDNPELRFWQALRAWSGFRFIGVSNDNVVYKDTFFWEEKTK